MALTILYESISQIGIESNTRNTIKNNNSIMFDNLAEIKKNIRENLSIVLSLPPLPTKSKENK